MTHSHSHSGSSLVPIGRGTARAVVVSLVCFALATGVGAAILWPRHRAVDIPLPFQDGSGGAVSTVAGHVVSTDAGTCGSPSAGRILNGHPVAAPPGGAPCKEVVIGIDGGPNRGADTALEFGDGPGQPPLTSGDKVRIFRHVDAAGSTSYAFYDYERRWPLVAIATAFALVVTAVAGWRGLRALAGIGIAFVVIVVFLLPALIAGEAALPVALVAAVAILFAVIYLAHGISMRTSAALLGTLASLLAAAMLSWVAIGAARLTGLSEDHNTEIGAYLGEIPITGLLLAGCVIGSLGVLNDVTVTQASAVFELATLGTTRTRRAVFAAAMRIGRDHIASTVYTLLLAYAGSALPLLLLFSVAGRSLSDTLTGESVAIEIVRAAVGGIALALSVPVTTAIATALITPARLPDRHVA